MRRYEHHWPDDPEAIVCERLEAIAADLERIRLSLEGENPEGGPLEEIADNLAVLAARNDVQVHDGQRRADALERIADALEELDDSNQ